MCRTILRLQIGPVVRKNAGSDLVAIVLAFTRARIKITAKFQIRRGESEGGGDQSRSARSHTYECHVNTLSSYVGSDKT